MGKKWGWKKTQSAGIRRRAALSSRPKNLSLYDKRLSTAKALTALANVTTDRRTRELARRDAEYFYKIIRVKKKKVIMVKKKNVVRVRRIK